MIRVLLAERLFEKRWPQAELIRRTGIRAETINDLYHEMATRISFENLDKICEALNCDVSDIIFREHKSKKSIIKHSFPEQKQSLVLTEQEYSLITIFRMFTKAKREMVFQMLFSTALNEDKAKRE